VEIPNTNKYQTVEKLEAFSERDNIAKQVGTVPRKFQIQNPINESSLGFLILLFDLLGMYFLTWYVLGFFNQ
jgi:hypothetical protein